MRILFMLALFAFSIGLNSCMQEQSVKKKYKTTGSIEILDQKLDDIISREAVIEILAEGFTWSEGPLWLEKQQMLLFTDVPENIIYKFTEKDSLEVYLTPSGYTGEVNGSGKSGGNGLLLNKEYGYLVICQHGDRRIAKMMSSLKKPKAVFETMASSFEGKRFNSPNDMVYDSKGDLYFTDPPYGLPGQDDDLHKEMAVNGVYRLSRNGKVNLLASELTRPNGIGLSPDETTLYVANSDPEKCLWMVYSINKDGWLSNGRVFFDATSMYNGKNGLADGLKVDRKGNIFATGPGGVLVFSPHGEHLGTIKTGKATANCAFNEDQSILYMTAHNYLMRIKLKPNEQN